MKIGDKVYEDLRETDAEAFERLQLEMALTCEKEGWCMEDGYDVDGRRYLIINPPPVINIEEFKTLKIKELKKERDIREVLPISCKGKIFDYDDKARERMRIAQQALEDNNIPSQTWTCADNTTTELTVEDFKAINTIAAQRSGQLHEQYNKLKVYIDALKTVEEVEIVTFDTEVV